MEPARFDSPRAAVRSTAWPPSARLSEPSDCRGGCPMTRPFMRRLSWVGAAALLGLAACNFPGFQTPQPEEDSLATAAAQTVAAQLTQLAGTIRAPSPQTSETVAPLATPSSTPVPSPTTSSTPSCTNQARFIRDVSIPDNTNIPAGNSFEKIWTL